MGKTKTGETSQRPGYAANVWGSVGQLSDLFSAQGDVTSPFYSDLQRMYSNTLGTSSFDLPGYLTKGLESAATTGLPSNTPLEQTQFYQAVAPEFGRVISEDVLPALKESFGAQGALRTGAYSQAAGKGVTSAIGDMILNAAQQAYALEEKAKARQMEAIPLALQAMLTPYAAAGAAGAAGSAIEASRYPLLDEMLAFIQTGSGQVGKGTQWQPNFGMSCCWTFLEGEGKITECVRRFRDEHFGKWSSVGFGYRWLSHKIVPLMKKFRTIKLVVKTLITSPLTKYAEFYYGQNKYGFVFRPLAYFWITIWKGIGRLIIYKDSRLIATVR